MIDIALDTHKEKMYHLDMKPGNVFIDSDGTFYFEDFGSAMRFADEVSPPAYRPKLISVDQRYEASE